MPRPSCTPAFVDLRLRSGWGGAVVPTRKDLLHERVENKVLCRLCKWASRYMN